MKQTGENSETYFLLLFSEYCSSPSLALVRAAGIGEGKDDEKVRTTRAKKRRQRKSALVVVGKPWLQKYLASVQTESGFLHLTHGASATHNSDHELKPSVVLKCGRNPGTARN
jgi:hypothetical protein